MKKLLMALVALSLCTFGASVSDAAFSDGWELTGGFNTSYTYNFNNPATGLNGGGTRTFLTRHNSFDFNRAELELEKTVNEWAKFRLDLAYGQDLGGGVFGQPQQAYAELTAPVGNGLTFTVGRFATIIGYEVIESFYNYNSSRSIAFGNAIPFQHQGILMTYPVNDYFSFSLGVVNSGAFGAVVDVNDSKGGLYQLAFTPNDMWSFSLQGSVGMDTFASDTGPTFLVDFVLNYMPTEMWTIGVNFDWRTTKGGADAGLSGSAGGIVDVLAGVLYVHYESEMYGATLRGEWFNDDNGNVTGVANNDIFSGTLTGHIYMGDGWETRLEGRFDRGDGAIYSRANGLTRKWDATFSTELLYKF